ncbi:MAG TPA: histidine kinase [Chitinophagaceae bacterium]
MKTLRSFNERPFIRIGQHLVFWVLSFVIFLYLFKSGIRVEKIDYIYTLLFHATLIPAVYINLEWLLPSAARRSAWLSYTAMVAALIAAFTWINYQFFQSWSSYILPDYYFISYFSYTEVSLFFIVYIGLTSLIKLSKSWFSVNELQRRLLQSEKEKVQIELKALRSQINPHFFFNTLNSIYSMSLEKDDRLPGTVLQLSELMRYFLYESKGEFVPLDKELAVLKDYISLQKLRSGNSLDLDVDIKGNMEKLHIAPLLLITFVENAFKHGAKGETGKTFIRLALSVEGNELNFRLENNIGVAEEIGDPEHQGVGLKNVGRRLQLLYPGKYELKAGRENNSFIVQLNLQMQHHV